VRLGRSMTDVVTPCHVERGNLTRRQDLQGVGARGLALLAAAQVWARAYTPQNDNCKFLDGSPMTGAQKKALEAHQGHAAA